MRPADLLRFPSDLPVALGRPRSTSIDRHWIKINPVWWHVALNSRGIPGAPLHVTIDDVHGPGISRRAIFDIAKSGSSDSVVSLLVHSLAWGGGRRARLMSKRLDSIAADLEGATRVLAEAAQVARHDPASAYDALYPSGRTRLKYLGPAFFTKFLYFAGGGVERHPCLILDSVTASALRSRGWEGLASTGWSASTYERYCALLSEWAAEAARRVGRPVAADEVERWLFGP